MVYSDVVGVQGLAVLHCLEQTLADNRFAYNYGSRDNGYADMKNYLLKGDYHGGCSFSCWFMLGGLENQAWQRGVRIRPCSLGHLRFGDDPGYQRHLHRYVEDCYLIFICY